MNNEIEIKEIPGFDGYGADKDGNIYSKLLTGKVHAGCRLYYQHGTTWRQRRVKTDTTGYPAVSVNGGKVVRVHVLIALTFLGARPDKMMVRHVDGNKKNPKLENLRYGTAKENAADMRRHVLEGKYGEIPVILPNEIKLKIRNEYVPYKTPVSELAKRYKISPWYVRLALGCAVRGAKKKKA